MTGQPTLFDAIPGPPAFGRAPFAAGSDTSASAADAIAPTAGRLRAAVLEYLRSRGEHGATDNEIQAALAMHSNTEGPRRYELVEAGLVRRSDQRRPTRSGRPAVVWVAADLPRSL